MGTVPPLIGFGPYLSGTFAIFSCIGTPDAGHSFKVACAASSHTVSPKDRCGGDAGWDTDP
jgi:hypothetical protein